jgi:hypothetical protein
MMVHQQNVQRNRLESAVSVDRGCDGERSAFRHGCSSWCGRSSQGRVKQGAPSRRGGTERLKPLRAATSPYIYQCWLRGRKHEHFVYIGMASIVLVPFSYTMTGDEGYRMIILSFIVLVSNLVCMLSAFSPRRIAFVPTEAGMRELGITCPLYPASSNW